MAGWFGPQGDCGCCGVDCGICNQVGPFTQCRFKVELSGAPTGTHLWNQHSGNGEDQWVEGESSNADSMNGTYFFDLTLDANGCPVSNQSEVIGTFTTEQSWDEYKASSSDCYDTLIESNSGGGKQGELAAEFQVDSLSQILKLELIRTENAPVWTGAGFDFASQTLLEWGTFNDCDKLPDGSEEVQFDLNFQTGSDDRNELSDPCVDDPSTTTYPITVKVTAEWT